MPRGPHSHLYCIELVGAPIAKIGIAGDPMKRIVALASHCPFTLSFRRVFRFSDMRDADAYERHILGKANSHREQGEWLRLDAALDALLDAVPALDVTEDFAGRGPRGRLRTACPTQERVNRLAMQVGGRAAAMAGYHGGAGDYDAAVVRACRADGLGVEDILVRHGIPVEFSWAVINGTLTGAQRQRGRAA